MIRIFAIYRSPHGAPAPFIVQSWDFAKGTKPVGGDQVFAASLDQANEAVPGRDGLVWHEPRKVPFEAPNLVGTWEPREEDKK